MKKIFFLTGAFLLFLVSCSEKVSTLNVLVDNQDLNGTTVYLHDDMFGKEVIDSAVIENGKFSFIIEPTVEKIKMVYFPDQDINLLYIAEPAKLTVDLNKNRFAQGGKLNAKLNEYLVEYEKTTKSYNDIRQDSLKTMEQKTEESNQLIEDFTSYINKVFENDFENNKDNGIATYLLTLFGNFVQPEEFLTYYEMAGPATKEAEGLKVRAAALANVKETSAGKMFKDASGVLPTDTTQIVSLSDYVGKGDYVIADFWASWCGPCIREMPFLKDIYSEFGPKGLKVLGVVVWDKLDKHLEKSTELGISWPQIFDLKRDVFTTLYGIQGIPTVILFDKDGTIISRDLRGEELKAKVKELYN